MIDLRKEFDLKSCVFKSFVDMSDEESDIVLKWRNDPKVRMWMNSDKMITLVEHRKFIDMLKKDDNNFYWLVSLDKKRIGVVYLNDVDWEGKNAWLGIYIAPEFHGQGFGSRIIENLEELVFSRLNFSKLSLETLSINERAKDFYLKLGFVETGIIKNRSKRNNENIDAIIMEKINEDKNI